MLAHGIDGALPVRALGEDFHFGIGAEQAPEARPGHSFIIDNVVNTLKGRTTLTTNALEGLKVVDIIERIYKLRK